MGNALALSQSFQDTIQLTLASASAIDGAKAADGLSTASGSVSKAMGSLNAGALMLGTYTFADLTPGTYAVAVFGPTRIPGANAASYRASVAAVPEIETWLMLLIGVGLVAYQLHRKQKALGQQVLNDEAMSSA
jgi:hypothetical protein